MQWNLDIIGLNAVMKTEQTLDSSSFLNSTPSMYYGEEEEPTHPLLHQYDRGLLEN